jgi:hypothetical protein
MNYMARLGRGAALLSIIFSLAYSIVQLMALLQWIPHPYDLIGMFLPSLLLAPCFVVVMIALHYTAPASARGFTMAGVGFSLVYCALVSVVYFTQLASVIPLQRKNELVDAGQLLFTGRSVMVAIDCLGYGFMSVATLFAAFAFRQYKKSKWLYRGLLAHGLLAPAIIGAFFFPLLMIIGVWWMVTLPLAMINALKMFRHKTAKNVFKENTMEEVLLN